MAYDDGAAERIREHLGAMHPCTEKRMFGGVAFFVNGNMVCGIMDDRLMVRVGPARYQDALAQPHAAVFERTGRPMTGWVSIEPAGYGSEEGLTGWLRQGVDFAAALPPK